MVTKRRLPTTRAPTPSLASGKFLMNVTLSDVMTSGRPSCAPEGETTKRTRWRGAGARGSAKAGPFGRAAGGHGGTNAPSSKKIARRMPLLAVPNVSEGRDAAAIDAIGAAFGRPAARAARRPLRPRPPPLGLHARRRAGRARARAGRRARARPSRASTCASRAGPTRTSARSTSPRSSTSTRAGAAPPAPRRCWPPTCSAPLGLPVYLYGALAGGRSRVAAAARAGSRRCAPIAPDFGPRELDDRTGAVLVAARPPLVAFNLELAPPAGLEDARRIAALVREGGEEGREGVRAHRPELPARGGVAQVSFNVEDPVAVPLADLLAAVSEHARGGGGRAGRARARRARSTAGPTTCPFATAARSRTYL